MEFINPLAEMLERNSRRTKVRCIECLYIHQEEKTKDHYFCLKARDFIEHKIDEKIRCNVYKSLGSGELGRR